MLPSPVRANTRYLLRTAAAIFPERHQRGLATLLIENTPILRPLGQSYHQIRPALDAVIWCSPNGEREGGNHTAPFLLEICLLSGARRRRSDQPRPSTLTSQLPSPLDSRPPASPTYTRPSSVSPISTPCYLFHSEAHSYTLHSLYTPAVLSIVLTRS